MVSDALCEGFKDLAEYDFDSEVSVTILGRIFEQSIADLEILTESISTGHIPQPKVKKTSVSGKRKKDGVVYTPDNITQFIVANTLGSHIDEQFKSLFTDYGKYKSDGAIQWKKGKQTEERFWFAWQEKLQSIKVVDPACGSGAFLIAAFDYLYSEYEKTNEKIAELTGQRGVLDLNKEILNNNLFGVDINEESIEITKLSLWLKTAERGKPLESLDANFITGNSLGFDSPAPNNDFYWQQAFPQIFKEGGFDVVLGNPPYVRQELLADVKPWLKQHYVVSHGVLDLFGYFFELGTKLLKPNGRMAYISSATFFKTSSGERLRDFLSSEITLEKIVDFGDLQVFEGVTTYPAILVLQKQPPKLNHTIDILVLRKVLPENLHLDFEQTKGIMKQTQLGTGNWQLEDEHLHQLSKKLKKNYPTLKEVYGSPLYGIKTGFNQAFVINGETRNAIIKQDPKSVDIIKPFLEGKDLKKWHSQPRDLFIIFTRRGINLDLYQGVKAYLENYRDRLEPKPKNWPKSEPWGGRKQGSYQWYEIQDSVDYYLEFEKPKIRYGHFSPEPLFHYNTDGSYSNDKSYIIPTNDLYLYGLLNSHVYWHLIKSMCPFVRGGFYEVRAQYIETLPIPPKPKNESISVLANSTQTQTESRYRCEQHFSRRLIDLCPNDQTFKINKKLTSWWQLDFSDLQKEIKKAFKGTIPLAERNDWQDYFEAEKAKREELSKEIQTLEDRLNTEVYALFDLTDDEIQLIEESST